MLICPDFILTSRANRVIADVLLLMWPQHINYHRADLLYSKKILTAPVFDRIPLAKKILLENIPLTKEHFLIMSPFLHDFKKFQPPNSLFNP